MISLKKTGPAIGRSFCRGLSTEWLQNKCGSCISAISQSWPGIQWPPISESITRDSLSDKKGIPGSSDPKVIFHNRNMFIKEITGITDYAHIMNEWADTAKQFLKRDDLDMETRCRLYDSTMISRGMSSNILSSKTPGNSIEIFIAEDRKQNLQGSMAFEACPQSLHVLLLVTNPINLMPQNMLADEDPLPVKGAASSLLTFAIKQCVLREKQNIFLQSVASAENFYKKFHFERMIASQEPIMNIPMKLTMEKIRAMHPHLFLSKKAS